MLCRYCSGWRVLRAAPSFLIRRRVLALTWWCLRRGSPVLAGIILGLIVVKPQLAFLVPLALLAGLHFRIVIAWASATAAIGLVTVAAVGTSGIGAYVNRLQDATSGLDAYQVPVGLTLPGLVGLREHARAGRKRDVLVERHGSARFGAGPVRGGEHHDRLPAQHCKPGQLSVARPERRISGVCS